MKKAFVLLSVFSLFILLTQGKTFAQLSGPKTIPGNYATIAAAITDLNLQGVGSGGVTFNVAAGHTETSANLIITATGTASNPIVFQKSGTGANPLITAGVGISTTLDGIILFSGTDYITFDGIDLQENPANTTTTTQMEWGYALLKVDGTNGSQNVTIRNCNITLNKTNTNSKGIYSANHTTATTTTLTVTDFAGTNSSNNFYSNTIQNCYTGIYVYGYADASTPYAYYDHFNEIGVMGGNTIRYFGGSSTITYGIYTSYQDSIAVNNNSVAGGTGTTTTIYGLYIYYGYNSSVNIYNNTVSDTTSSTTSAAYGIYVYYAGNSGVDNTVNIKRNTVQGMTSTAATSAALYGYYLYYIPAYILNIDSNKFVDNKWGGPTQTATGTIYGFYIYPYTTTPVAGSVQNITNNYMSGNKRTQSVVGAGTLYGMYIYYGNQTVNAYNNIIENDTLATTTSTQYYMYIYNYYSTTVNYHDNAVRNISKTNGSTGALYGIYISNAAYSGTFNFYDNTVNNLIGDPAASGIIYGIYNAASSVSKNFYNNSVYNLRASVTGSVYGIYFSSGTTTNYYNNNVYNLRASTGTAYGMYVASGTTNNIYNNYISDIKADSSINLLALYGLYIGGGTTNNVYYNTIYLNSVSTGTTFGTAALYASTTPTVDLRNNIIVNMSTPGTAGGYTTAYYRSSATLTTYSSLSNNNDFYAGTPDTNHIIYYDGTNYMRTISDFKGFVAPRDANSFTENPPFVNVTTPPYNLHINAAVATQCESNGITVSAPISIVDDFDGQPRYPNPGYPNNPSYPASAPDVGADEFGGIPLDLTPPTIAYTPLLNTSGTSARNLAATITDASGVPISGISLPRLYWRINAGTWSFATPSVAGSVYTFNFGGGATTGDVIYYYICAQDGATPPNVGASPSGGAGGFTANPPAASIPPTTPSSYTITAAALTGDYTVGTTMFNLITGKNITFKKVVTKVMKEVEVEEPVLKKPDEKGKTTVVEDATVTKDKVSGKKHMVAVEEIKWVPMENGKEYKGDLYVKKSENPQYNYPMNTMGVYATLTAAIADLNLRGVSGHTRFLLNDATYPSETFPIIVNIANENVTSATKTVTIKPNTGVTSTISGIAAASRIFTIRDNYVTIDGSNTTSGITRDLTIQNTSPTTPQVIVVGSTGTTPITNVTVKNCNIINGVNSSSAMVISDGNAPGTAGWFNNITVQNNSFQLAYIALYNIATIASGNGTGLNITGNDFNTSGTNAVRLVGVYVQGVDGATVSNNNIGNFNILDASNTTGVWFATGTVNSTISDNTITNLIATTGPPRGIAVSSAFPNANVNITGNTISNITTTYSSPPYGIYVFSTTSGISIKKNKISGLLNTNTGGYGARGINVATTVSPANIDVINNFVWNIKATADASVTYWGIGIAIDATINTVNVYFNSVNLYDTLYGYTSATVHSAFYVAAGVTAINVRDNIFVNSYDNTNSTTDKSYSIYSAAANTAYTDINYCDYYVSGTPGVLGYLGGDKTTLADWRIATGQDLNSISGDPIFLSNTDLHIDPNQVSPVSNAGQFIATVLDDIDGNTRLNPPDIGADEYTYIPGAPSAPILSLPVNGATGVSLTPLLDWNDVSGADSYRIQLSTNSGFTTTVFDTSGVTVSQLTVPAGKLNNNTQYYWRANATNTGGTSSWSIVWNFTTILAAPIAPTLLLPSNGATGISVTPLLDWNDVPTAASYRIQLSTNSGFTTTAFDTSGVTVSQLTVPAGKLNNGTQYYWRVNATNVGGTSPWSTVWNFTTVAAGLPMNLKVYLEGFWNGTTQVADTVRIYLANSTTPYAYADTQKVVLSSTGTANLLFTRASGGNYYIVVAHRNHLETWSRLPQTLTPGTPVNYDFTTDSAKAYGLNMKKVGSVWVLYGGDPNQDGSIDALDISLFVAQFGSQGYLSCDFNGDNDVNALDVQIIAANFGLTKATPTVLMLEPVIKKKEQIIPDIKKEQNKQKIQQR